MALFVRRVDEFYGIFNSFDSEFFNPFYFCIEERDILDYVDENPFPDDPDYSVEDLVYDLTRSRGSYIIPCRYEETAEYICQLIMSLV